MNKTVFFAVAAACVVAQATSRKPSKSLNEGKSGTQIEIVIPEKPNVSERIAADELRHHFVKATGGSFRIVTETAPKSGLRRFYVGRAAASGGVDVAALKPEERIVKGIGGDVFLAGGDRGVDRECRPGDTGGEACF